MGIVFPWADAPSITRKARLRCSSGDSTPAGEVTISRVELVILLSRDLYVCHWHAELDADSKELPCLRACPFPEILSSRVPLGVEARGAVEYP
jgi:hypothetical protein